jgi:ABC-2 type transport system permease protein
MIFLAILLKELKSFMRSAALVAVVVYSFTIDIYVAGEGIDIEPRNVAVEYVDNSGGGVSQKILSNLHAPEFVHPTRFYSQSELSSAIYNKEIMVGLVFESDFEKRYREKKDTQLNVLLDATSASRGFTTSAFAPKSKQFLSCTS